MEQKNGYSDDQTLVQSIYVDPGVSADSTVLGINLFAMMHNAVTIDASNLDVSQMTTLAGAFTQDENLKSVNVSGWNTSNVTTMQNMFHYDTALKTVDLSSFDTSKVTNTSNMFAETGLTSLDLSNFDMSNVTDASGMFMTDRQLAQLSLSSTANLKASGLPDAKSQVITLPDGSSTNTVNGWQAVGSGTVATPTGAVLKSADLMTLYDGTGTAPAETYVWSPSVANSVTVIDAYTGKAVVSQDIDGVYGTDANFTSLIPKDYHLASGDELGSYTQPTSTKIGTTGTHFDVYVAPNTVDTINFVDDDNNGAIVRTDKIGGTSGDVSDYTTSDDVAALTDKGYEIVSSDVPSSITYNDTTEHTYTVHVKHIIKTVKGTDADADKGTQVKLLTVNFSGDPSDTGLTSADVAPTGDLSQDLTYYRDAVEDEALKAAGDANYATLGDWYTSDSLTPVEIAEVPGYSANFAGPITMDAVFDSPQVGEIKMGDLLKNSVAGTDDHTSLTVNIKTRYTANTYGTQIKYVNQDTGEQVGTIESIEGVYKTELPYPVIAPNGYEVVPNQDGVTNNKIILTFLPDMDPVTIYVTPIVTLQSATVTYQDEDGTQLGAETLTGNSDTAIPFDTASYIAAKFAHYDLVSDETTTPATFDEDSTSAQDFNVVLRLQNVTTPVTPVDSAGNPIPGTTPTQEAGHPGQPITDFPTVDGYVLVPNQAVYFPANDGDVTNVYYLPGTQEATVHFTDQNGKSLGTLEVAGESGAEIEHHNIDTVTLQIINQGYSLKSDDTVGATFDNDSSANQDFNVVLNKLDTPSTDTITKTVHYVDPEGNSLAPDYVSSVEIQQTLDSETNKPNADTTAVLGHQADPTIAGYKVLIDSAGATTDQTVNFGDTDMTYTVVYISDDVTTPNNYPRK
ncbi:mucin-binding protein [Secundilactobacillus odoratitofui]|uniref:mucin-binding protein n=1 Tax=Secundilactobacillus odoratitofui TaxID=480930 RepID=UPI0006D1A0F4|nr:BspA family leucine-rich repeat surface protein [Secundilactobacillus odoratitofui]